MLHMYGTVLTWHRYIYMREGWICKIRDIQYVQGTGGYYTVYEIQLDPGLQDAVEDARYGYVCKMQFDSQDTGR